MKVTDPIDLCTATDAELIQLCRQGNQNAYGQIIERYKTLVCSVGYNRCGDLALSEDLAQEGFILAWQKLDTLKDDSKFKAWICTIVRNLANRASQRLGRSVIHGAAHLDAVVDIPSDIKSPFQQAVNAEEEKLVWQALADIPENYREPLILYYREEQSVARVAEALDLSEDAVKQRLSRGRKMLQQHLAVVVESTLVNSKPAKVFTSTVLLGLSGVTANSAAAAGVTTATVTAAKTATGIGLGSGLSILFLWPILKLPLIFWMHKNTLDEARSERERRLLRRQLSLMYFFILVVFTPVIFSWIWWQKYIEPPMLRRYLPAAIMVLFMIPMIVYCRKMGKRIESIRKEEGTFTPPRPLVESENGGPIALKVSWLFCLCSLLVMAGPSILPFVAHDWLVLSAMIISAICISLIAAQISLHLPKKWSLRLFVWGNTLTVFMTLGIMLWRYSVWGAAFDNFILWFVGTMNVQSMTHVILIMIARKRVYGKPKSPGEDR
ncbi:MAG: hypothetical protein COA78_13045 [Blastopirellula sp.]|nr:MAG: hypothetical protein COA78_13045 [Blastopirellula sp.]